ncbi:hypothetical protein BH11MYX1_BH11MYX1_25600 [soil metagenome]
MALLGACGFQPGLTGGGTNDGSTDPDGSIDSSVHDGGGAGSDASVVPTGRCSSPGALRDDFTTGVTGGTGQWFALGTSSVTGGALSVTPSSASGFAGYFSKHAIDLTGANITVEVPAMIATAANATAGLYLFNDQTHYLALYQQLGMLVAEYQDGGSVTNQRIAYDPTKLWWRVTETAGQIAFQWSPDTTNWTAFGPALPTPAFTTSLGIGLGGVSYDGQAHGSARFDNLNQAADPAPWCKSSTFLDRFARTTIGIEWRRRLVPTNGNGCLPTVSTGAHFDQSGTANSRCWLVTAKAFELADSSAMIYVPAITSSQPGWSVFLRGVTDNLDAFSIQYQDPAMLCAQVNATPLGCKPYSATYLYFRIRETTGQLYFEASADATAWVNIAQAATSFSVATSQFELGTATTAGFGGAPLQLTISDYNTTP